MNRLRVILCVHTYLSCFSFSSSLPDQQSHHLHSWVTKVAEGIRPFWWQFSWCTSDQTYTPPARKKHIDSEQMSLSRVTTSQRSNFSHTNQTAQQRLHRSGSVGTCLDAPVREPRHQDPQPSAQQRAVPCSLWAQINENYGFSRR